MNRPTFRRLLTWLTQQYFRYFRFVPHSNEQPRTPFT